MYVLRALMNNPIKTHKLFHFVSLIIPVLWLTKLMHRELEHLFNFIPILVAEKKFPPKCLSPEPLF